jgi:hypothetical protein
LNRVARHCATRAHMSAPHHRPASVCLSISHPGCCPPGLASPRSLLLVKPSPRFARAPPPSPVCQPTPTVSACYRLRQHRPELSRLCGHSDKPMLPPALLLSPSATWSANAEPLPPALQEEGSIQGLRGEEGYPQDGDGTPPGCDGGAEHSSTGRSVRDRDSPHLVAECRCHYPRLHEDGRGLGQ